jgi:hypothetical protein
VPANLRIQRRSKKKCHKSGYDLGFFLATRGKKGTDKSASVYGPEGVDPLELIARTTLYGGAIGGMNDVSAQGIGRGAGMGLGAGIGGAGGAALGSEVADIIAQSGGLGSSNPSKARLIGSIAGGLPGIFLGAAGADAILPHHQKDRTPSPNPVAGNIGKAAAIAYKKAMGAPGMGQAPQAQPQAQPAPNGQKSPLPATPGAPNPMPTGQPLPAAAQLPPQQAPMMQMQPAPQPSPNALRANSLMQRVVGGVNQMQQQPQMAQKAGIGLTNSPGSNHMAMGITQGMAPATMIGTPGHTQPSQLPKQFQSGMQLGGMARSMFKNFGAQGAPVSPAASQIAGAVPQPQIHPGIPK